MSNLIKAQVLKGNHFYPDTKRSYAREILIKAVDTFRSKYNNENPMLCCMEGDIRFSPMDQISHLITELWYDLDEDTLYANIKVLDTPSGLLLSEVLETNPGYWTASGFATLTESKGQYVVGDYELSGIGYCLEHRENGPVPYAYPDEQT